MFWTVPTRPSRLQKISAGGRESLTSTGEAVLRTASLESEFTGSSLVELKVETVETVELKVETVETVELMVGLTVTVVCRGPGKMVEEPCQ